MKRVILFFLVICISSLELRSQNLILNSGFENIDINNNVTTDYRTASLVRIKITSLLQANIRQNFTFLANYQFVQGDRLRILDDGNNNLFDTATYGSLLDVEIQGQTYNQAAINANLIPPPENLLLNQTDTSISDVYVYAKYDNRFDKLKDKTGFWIELYTPSETIDITPCYQCGGWMPIIGGDVATFNGLDNFGNPQYLFPRSGDIEFWDTYLINRVIILYHINNKCNLWRKIRKMII